MLLRPMARVVRLATPPVLRVVPDGVFDAFGWCDSDALEWRAPDGTTGMSVSRAASFG